MKRFKAYHYDEEQVVLSNDEELDNLFKCIEEEEDFIISWKEQGVQNHEVIMANHLLGKVKSGDFTLSARDKKTEE